MNIGDCFAKTAFRTTNDIWRDNCRATTWHTRGAWIRGPRVTLRSTHGYSKVTATRSQTQWSPRGQRHAVNATQSTPRSQRHAVNVRWPTSRGHRHVANVTWPRHAVIATRPTPCGQRHAANATPPTSRGHRYVVADSAPLRGYSTCAGAAERHNVNSLCRGATRRAWPVPQSDKT
jgi:hypothetical protein